MRSDFVAYQDLESSFERRPSLWVEPIGDWGEGAVVWSKFPPRKRSTTTSPRFWQSEGAACRPRANTLSPTACIGDRTSQAVVAGAVFPYRRSAPRATIPRLFVLDLIGDRLKTVDPKAVRGDVSAPTKAKIQKHRHPAQSGDRRLAAQLSNFPSRNEVPVELRAVLMQDRRARCQRSGFIDGHRDQRPRSAPAARQTPRPAFLPAEAPLEMPAQPLREPSAAPFRLPRASRRCAPRRAVILAGTAIMTRGRLL